MIKYIVQKYSSKGGRSYNQDYCDYKEFENGIVIALADGLGGHSGGEKASSLVVKSVLDSDELSSADIASLFNIAQANVHKAQKEDEKHHDMKTTLVLCVVLDKIAHIGHIGDSRLYIFRNNEIIFQTKDHSLVQLYVDLGEISFEEIRTHPDKNVVRRVIGDVEKFKPEIGPKIELVTGDIIMLCSDGFWEYITEEEMTVLKHELKTSKVWLDEMVKKVFKTAEKAHDNLSVIMLELA